MEPINRREVFLNALAKGEPVPIEPLTREEVLLAKQAEREAADLVFVITGDHGNVTSKDQVYFESGSFENVLQALRANRAPVVKMKIAYNPKVDTNLYRGCMCEVYADTSWYGGIFNFSAIIEARYAVEISVHEIDGLWTYTRREITRGEPKQIDLNE